MPNFAALRAVVCPLSTKNLRGADLRPPPSVRGLTLLLGGGGESAPPGGFSYLYQKPFALAP